MLLTIPILAIALSNAALPETATSKALYDFKGIQLQTPLEDFRSMPHPDGTSARVVCTGEKVGKRFPTEPANVMVFNEIEKELGVKKCIWIGISDESFFNDTQSALSLANSGYAAYDYSFYFIPDPNDNILRLFKFRGTSNASATNDVIDAISNKYGLPKITKDTVQNKIGNEFIQTTAVWNNTVSELIVQDRYTQIDKMGITMTDNRLNDVLRKKIEDEEAAKPNPI